MTTQRIPRNGVTLELIKERTSTDHRGCWIWQGATQDGYASTDLRYRGKRYKYGHRLAYALQYGEIAEGKQIHHTCAQSNCVNPGHLMMVTGTDNMAEMQERNRLLKLLALKELEIDRLRDRLEECSCAKPGEPLHNTK